GADQVKTFLGRAEILVLLMPATPETRHILNEETLAYLPAGAFVINAGRGDLIDEPALISALDSGHLGGAALDVFEQEPLPVDNPLWNHPKVLVTPHIGSITFPPTACRYIADAIKARGNSGEWPNLVKTEEGY
ncbi:MAG: NAD(P)-dependent oxidoreductase, partial [Gammaproteobacteria bacterium]